jgi:glucokinase
MFLGIEIGGTKLQLGVGRGDGVLAGLWRQPVEVTAGPEGIRRQILAAVPELLSRAGIERGQVRGIGIGFGGPVEDATQTVIKSHQIEGWDSFPLAAWITQLVGWPAVLGNDADVAGLAEALFGAGKGLSPIFYITIGSGIGGGLILDGEIYRGCGRGAAEIGHLRLPSGPQTEVLEHLASGWAIGKQARRQMQQGKGRDSLLFGMLGGQYEQVTAWHVGQAALQRDDFARAILKGAWDALADAMVQVITLLAPRRIVVGGGVSLLGEELFFAPLRKLVAERVFPPFAGCTDIVPAALGEEVVVHGALALARRRFAC